MQYVFDDDRVIVTDPDLITHWKWSGFETVAEADDIFVLRFRSSEALVVPKRGVSNPAELARLSQLINLRGAARAVTPYSGFEVV